MSIITVTSYLLIMYRVMHVLCKSSANLVSPRAPLAPPPKDSPDRPRECCESMARLRPPPRVARQPFYISGQLNLNGFWCRRPSRPASWSTIASVIGISSLIDYLGYYLLLNLDLTNVSLGVLCVLNATNGFFVQILLRVLSSSIMCHLILSILPIFMVKLSYGIMKDKFFSCLCVGTVRE